MHTPWVWCFYPNFTNSATSSTHLEALLNAVHKLFSSVSLICGKCPSSNRLCGQMQFRHERAHQAAGWADHLGRGLAMGTSLGVGAACWWGACGCVRGKIERSQPIFDRLRLLAFQGNASGATAWGPLSGRSLGLCRGLGCRGGHRGGEPLRAKTSPCNSQHTCTPVMGGQCI
jgi:hypothetical protein